VDSQEEKPMNGHFHPPRQRSTLDISDEWVKYLAGVIVRRAEQKVLSEQAASRYSPPAD
jgi:hypothetical protein